jgi:hypothetical protein
VIIGKTSELKTFTISNTGGADLTISDVKFEGTDYSQFNITADELPWNIAVEETKTFAFTFNPNSVGEMYVDVNIIHNANDSPSVVSLTGIGIVDVPGQVTLASPIDGATDVSVTPSFLWQATTTGETPSQYRLEISQSKDFEDVVFYETIEHPKTEYTIETPPLIYNTQYYWRVVAINGISESIENDVWMFTTQIAPPGQVTLLSPISNAVDVPTKPTFTWQKPEGTVTGYRIYIGDTENPSNSKANLVHTIEDGATSWEHESDLEEKTTYHWQIVAFNTTGSSEPSYSWNFTTTIITDTDDDAVLAYTTELLNNFPNPFNPYTTISFTIETPLMGSLLIEVYNIKGQRVRTLVNDHFPAGRHSVVWNGTDDNGKTVSSGVYFYMMRAGDYMSVRRMLLMK